jgi:DNA-binding XRE family transcriptional regulator
MPYSERFISRIKAQPITLGSQLGRWAIYHSISPTQIAQAVGATRQSVYNWMKGGGIFHHYQPAVERLIHCLQSSKTTDEALLRLRREFNLRT